MNIKLDTVIKDIKGDTLKEGDKEITARDLFLNAILSTPMSPEGRPKIDNKKVEKFKLSLKLVEVKKDEMVKLTSKEVTLLKDSIDAIFSSPLVVGRLNEILGEI